MNAVVRKMPYSLGVNSTPNRLAAIKCGKDTDVDDVSTKPGTSFLPTKVLNKGTPTFQGGLRSWTLKRTFLESEKAKDQSEQSSPPKKLKGSEESEDWQLRKRQIKSDIPNLCSGLIESRPLTKEHLHCDYFWRFYTKQEADHLLQACEESLEYFTGKLATVKLYGKNIPIPRKQTAHGDEGLTYRYSGVTVPAKPWLPVLESVRNRIESKTGFKFNFVLINRYKDGYDSIGEHRDDEKDLAPKHPIASLSLGQERDFIFRHKDSRGRLKTRSIEPVKIVLGHGSLLMMNHPTNQYWYHSLPRRPTQKGVRINMTFRKILRS